MPKTCRESVLKTGVFTGRGGTLFCFWQVAHKTADIISISIPQELPEWKTAIFQKLRKTNQNLHFIRENSHSDNALKQLKNILRGRKIDFLFIDGDHTYQGVKKDFTIYKEMVKKGGIIAFHDIVPSSLREMGSIEVDLFWKEIKQNYSHKEFIAESNQDGWGIGVVYV